MTNHKQQQASISVVLPGSEGIPAASALDKATHVTLPSSQASSKAEQYIIAKGKETLVLELVTAGVVAYAVQLNQALTLRSAQYFDQFIEVDRAIRDKPRAAVDQADVDVYNQTMRQLYASSSVAITKAGTDRIQEVANTSLKPPEEEKKRVRIIKEPGLLGRVLSGQTTTEVWE
jgi:hypothetical protein